MSDNNQDISRARLREKIKELHTHSYLTLLSIGQAVSFHLLTEEISVNKKTLFVPISQNFLWLPWLLALETFILLILVWNDYMAEKRVTSSMWMLLFLLCRNFSVIYDTYGN